MALASSVRIEIAGKEIADFLEFSIDQKIHNLQKFSVTCRMDTFEDQDQSVLNKSKEFVGSPIIISIEKFNKGWKESSPGFLFKGFIHSVRAVKSEANMEDRIILEGSSPDFLLNNQPGCQSFENVTLKQVVDNVLKPYPRDILASKVNPEYKEQIPFCVKYNETNYDFLQRLASRYGEWLYYNGKELIFGSSQRNNEELVLGKELKSLDFSINLKAPCFKYVSYDYLSAKTVETKTTKSMGATQQNEVGKIAHSTSWKQMGQDNVQYYPHLNVNPGKETKAQQETVETKASGIALGMSGIRGSSENMNLIPGCKITIKEPKSKGSGEIDYGEYIIDSIQHYCDNLMNYGNSFTALPSEAKISPMANPEIFPYSDPQSAIVKDNNDPEKLGRVKVSFIWQESTQMTPWIRVISLYAANERGFYFIPEIGDEVLVGFEAGDAEKPFVMGSLYHGKNRPFGAWPNDKNNFKGIVTRSNLRLEFDEDKKITTIDTPGGNKIVVSDDDKSILLSDQSNNRVEMSPGGIAMSSDKDISISSKAKVTIEAMGAIEVKSNADVNVSGLNIKHSADVGFTAKGNASAELSGATASFKGDAQGATLNGGALTTIKGAVVMIN